MKPQFKPEEIYLDLSKLSEEQQERVMCVTGTTIEWIKYAGYLIYHKGWKTSNKSWLKDQNLTELTYSQFLDMMGESEEVLQVENNSWIKIESEKDLPKEDISCWWMDKKDGMILGKFLIENNNSDIDFILENATHYQPLIIPEPPKF